LACSKRDTAQQNNNQSHVIRHTRCYIIAILSFHLFSKELGVQIAEAARASCLCALAVALLTFKNFSAAPRWLFSH